MQFNLGIASSAMHLQIAATGIVQMGSRRMLVVFYSRSGTTRAVAKSLSETLKCEFEDN
jgi:hypothetical protein